MALNTLALTSSSLRDCGELMICEPMALVYPQGSLANSCILQIMMPQRISLPILEFYILSFPEVRKGSNITEHLLCVWYYIRHSFVLTVRLSGIYNDGCYSIHKG